MAPRNRNRNNQRTNQRMPSRVAAPVAPTPVRAPMPSNTYGGNVRYIENLYPKGTKEYNYFAEKVGPGYDGGNYASTTGTPGVDAATDDDLRAYAKAVALKGNTYDFGDMSGVRAAAAEFDAQQAAQSQTAAATTPTAQNYRGLKSINQGLKLGGDNILGRREAMKIARGTGRDFDKVLTKALGQGMSIGGGAVRQSNKTSGTSQLTPTIKGQQMFTSGGSSDPLSAMRRVTPGKRQMYSGTYELDGKTMPLIESRRGGVASNLGGMTAGGGRRRGGGKGKGRGRRGRGSMGDMGGMDMGTTQQTPSMADYIPPAMEEPTTEEDININFPGVGENVFSSATGFRSKRSSRKRAGSTAQGLASQRINPTGSWNYRI